MIDFGCFQCLPYGEHIKYAVSRGFLWYNRFIEKISGTELNKLSKAAIIALYTQMSESLETLSKQNEHIQKQNEKLSKQIDDLTEKLAILTMQRFGKKTETAGQLSFDL